MSSINLNNYEAYMLDHLEGNLSPQDTLALRAFAILHPELNLNLDEELVSLEKENMSFDGKQNLKANFDDALVIGYLENALTGEEKVKAKKLESTNVLFKKELELYQKTIAAPDETLVFEDKALLKRQPKIIIFNQSFIYRAAAAILLLAGIWIIVSKLMVNDPIRTPEVAANTKRAIPLNNNPAKEMEAAQVNHPEKTANSPSLKRDQMIVNIARTDKESILVRPEEKEEHSAVAVISDEETMSQQEPVQPTDSEFQKTTEFANQEKSHNTYIIEEVVDDEATTAATQPKKNKLFNLASRALKKLNHNGVASVNGSANDNELFIGSLSISKKL